LVSTHGAMHALTERPLNVRNLVRSITAGIVEASSKAGVSPPEVAIIGTSQGVIQWAVETESDINGVVQQTLYTTREIAAQTGLSEETVVTKTIEST
jgi:hypothetical protein